VLNEVMRIYVRQNIDRTSAEAAQSLAFLKGQLPQVRKDVEQAEAALNQFQIRNKTIDISLKPRPSSIRSLRWMRASPTQDAAGGNRAKVHAPAPGVSRLAYPVG
jgi:hypothetical protein